MPLLPPVTQVFTLDGVAFQAGVDDMLAGIDRLAEGIDGVLAGLDRMVGGSSAAGEADERLAEAMDAVAAAGERQAEVMAQLDATLDENTAALDVNTAALDEQAAALDREGAAAEGATGKTATLGTQAKVAFLAVGAALVYGVVKAAEYQSQMATLLTQAGVAKSQFKGLESGVLSLAGQVGFSPTSLAQALYHIESSFQSVGITGPKALQLLQIAAEGAATGHANLVDVTNALDASIAAGVTGIHNYSQAMGALNAIVGSGDMTMQDLANAMGTGLMAVAKSYGQSIYQVGAALATLGDNNIRGAKAATDLRMAWQAVQAPLAAGVPVLKSLGLSANALAQTMEHQGLTAALAQFIQHLQASKVPISDWGQLITEIFGKRAGVGIGVLIDQLSRLQGKIPDIEHGANTFGSAWNTTNQTLAQQWKNLLSGLEALAVSFGTVLLPAATKVVGVLASFIHMLEQHPALAAFAGALLAVVTAMKIFEGVAAALDVVMDANPIMLVVLAVIALAAGLYELYHRSKTVRDALADVGHFLGAVWSAVWHAAGDVIRWFEQGPLVWIKQQLAQFSQFWNQHSQEIRQVAEVVWKLIHMYIVVNWDIISAVLKAGLTFIAQNWRNVWDFIRDSTRITFDLIKEVIHTALQAILGVIGVILDLITGHWSKAGQDLLTLTSNMFHDVIAIIKTITSGFGTLLYDAGRALIQGLINGIKDMVGAAVSAAKSVGSTIVGAVKGFFGISSPSALMRWHGLMIALGLEQGIEAGRAGVSAAADRLASAAGGGGAGGVGGLATTGSRGDTYNIHLTVQGFVGNQQELLRVLTLQVQQGILQLNKRNPSNMISLAAGRFG